MTKPRNEKTKQKPERKDSVALERINAAIRSCFTAPDKSSVSEWAEANIVLTSRESEVHGALSFDRSPYLREVLDNLSNDEVRQITLCFGSQSAKTIALFCIVAWCVCENPAPILLVYPSLQLAKWTSENRLSPLIDECEALREHLPKDPDKNTLFSKQFDTCTLTIVGAGSPSQLKSRPTKYLICDEIDEFKAATDKQASALDVVRNRTKGFRNSKIVLASTPTTKGGNIWREFMLGDQRYFFLRCPNPQCQHYQTLKLTQLKWSEHAKHDDAWDLDNVADTAYYECEKCGMHWLDRHKPELLLSGEWRATQPERKAHRSYHLSSLYPLWVPFGSVAVEFLKAKDFPESLRAFRQEWLAECWEETPVSVQGEGILKLKDTYEEGTCPAIPTACILAADYGKTEIWYAVRAFTADGTSYLIRCGAVASLEDLLPIVHGTYTSALGTMKISHACIDSGWEAKEVYQFANDAGFVCVKGQPSRMNVPYRWTNIDGQKLLLVNDDMYKEKLQDRLRIERGKTGSHNLYAGVPDYYAKHMTAEVATKKKNKYGNDIVKWVRHGENGLMDCEKYAYALADVIGAKFRDALQYEPQPTVQQKPQQQQQRRFIRDDGRSYYDVGKF